MTEVLSSIDDWSLTLLRKAKRHSIVFLQLGAAFAKVREDCLRRTSASLSVDDYLDLPAENIPASAIIAITNLEDICISDHDRLGRLRARVHEDYSDDKSFVLVSRFPRSRFPEMPGSSILIDAMIQSPPLIAKTAGDPSSYSLPCDEGEGLSREQANEILVELGSDVVTSIDYLMYEHMAGPQDFLAELDSYNHSALEALRGSGLIYAHDGSYQWTYHKSFGTIRQAVSDTISQTTSPPPSIGAAFGLVWAIERMVRAAMRNRALRFVSKPAWQASSVTNDLRERILLRATQEAYVGANSVNEIRDPFEWLTLGELLDLRQAMTSYGDMGLTGDIWRRFAVEVLPIRNKVSHMRLLRDSDLDSLRRWHRALGRKLEF